MLKQHQKLHQLHHRYLVVIYGLMGLLTVWKLGATLFNTAQIIRYRTIASTITHQETKIDSGLTELNTQVAQKKSMTNVININQFNAYRPINVYSSLTQTSAVANLLP